MSNVLYTLAEGLFYEAPEAYQPDASVRRILRNIIASDWTFRHHGIWLFAEPPCRNLPEYGNKIHVSTRPETRAILLQKTAAIAVEHHTTFKCFADFHLWNRLHDKPYASQYKETYGKAITLYPENDEVFSQLASKLASELQDYRGPDLFTDEPVHNSKTVFYRYGGFLTPDEDDEDIEADEAEMHASASEEREAFTAETPHPIDAYEFLDAIQISAAGGVYIAEHTFSGERFIIKEANEDTCVFHGKDAVDRLKSELDILHKLHHLNISPNPIESFTLWRNLFVVMEHVPGETLSEIIQKPLSLETRRNIAAGIADAVAILHDEIIWGDVSPANVLYDPDTDKIRLVDFELARSVRDEEKTPVPAGTPGFTAPHSKNPKTLQSERIDLGLLLLWIFAPVNEMYPLNPGATRRFVKTLKGPLPTKLVKVLENCLDPENNMTAKHIAGMLKEIQIQSHTPAFTDSSHRELPSTPEIRQYRTTFEDIFGFITTNLTFDRNDRLFPCPPEGFQDPLSIAYGASGLLNDLENFETTLAAEVLNWIRTHPDTSDAHKLAETPGYWHGTAGIATVLNRFGETQTARKYFEIAEKHIRNTTEFNQYDGVAGVAHAALNLYTQTNDPYYLDTAVNLADALISQSVAAEDTDAVTRIWKHRDDDTLRPGFLFGIAGVAAFLFQLADELDANQQRYTDIAEPALLWVEKQMIVAEDGRLATPMIIGSHTFARNFAHGTAGVAKAFLLVRPHFGTDKDAFIRDLLLPPHPSGMPELTNTPAPGQFYGLAGIGDVLVDAYSMSGDPAYLLHAHQLLKEILCFQVADPKRKGIGFPGGEHLTRLSCDYATGSLGVAHFIHRFLNAIPVNGP